MWVVISELGTATNGGNREIRIEPNCAPYHGGTPKFDVLLYEIDSDNRIRRTMLMNCVDFDTAKNKIAKSVPEINAREEKRKEEVE